jgi:hypothetical protein
MRGRWNLDFLDLLTALNDADARYMLVGGYAVALFGHPRVPCYVLSRSDLIANKRAAGRRQDLADVEALERDP